LLFLAEIDESLEIVAIFRTVVGYDLTHAIQ